MARLRVHRLLSPGLAGAHLHTASPLPTRSASCSRKCPVEHVVFSAQALGYINRVVKFKGKSGWDPRGSQVDVPAGAGLAWRGRKRLWAALSLA